MPEAILGAVVAAAVVALLVHTLARRSAPAADGTVDRAPPRTDLEPSGGSRERAALADPKVWRSVVVYDLAVAEELLDWAESEGYREREMVVVGNSTFLVRWRDRA